MLPFDEIVAKVKRGADGYRKQLNADVYQPPIQREKVRQASNRDKLLAVLKARRVITNVEAVDICGLGYSGRIYELRKRGHQIEVTRRQGGLWEIAYLS